MKLFTERDKASKYHILTETCLVSVSRYIPIEESSTCNLFESAEVAKNASPTYMKQRIPEDLCVMWGCTGL